MGKHKPTYTPHTDAGDYVIVINAREVQLTRTKPLTKIYSQHSGYPGGLKQRTFTEMLEKHPEEVIRRAVVNMLPKNRLRQPRMVRLKVYPGAEHPHQSQMGGK
jgi:large subunit ribosomal protein L13